MSQLTMLRGDDVRLLNASEAAARLGISPATVYRLWAVGELGCVKLGRARRCLESDIANYIKANHSGGPNGS